MDTGMRLRQIRGNWIRSVADDKELQAGCAILFDTAEDAGAISYDSVART
jgi:hypothetical protein